MGVCGWHRGRAAQTSHVVVYRVGQSSVCETHSWPATVTAAMKALLNMSAEPATTTRALFRA